MEIPRQQRIDGLDGLGRRQLAQHPAQPGVRLEAVGTLAGWTFRAQSRTSLMSVSDLLVPASRRHASAQQELPPAIGPKTTAAKKPASTKEQTVGARIALLPDAKITSGPTGVAAETNTVMGQQDQAAPSAAESAIQQPVDGVSFSARSLASSLRQPL
jgi:hypothetical protein